jgi:hypothetical protein
LRNAHCFWNICPKTNIFAQNLGSIRENLLESHDNKIFSHKWSLCCTCSWLVLHFCNKLYEKSTFVNLHASFRQDFRENFLYWYFFTFYPNLCGLSLSVTYPM